MRHQHPDRVIRTTFSYDSPVPVDWKKYRTVVIESDDWGIGLPGYGLETAEELEELYGLLEKKEGTITSQRYLPPLHV